MVRMSAEERRERVIRAAISEFARGGYHGTSTQAIARRVGVSQPCLFRLFPNKQAIFLAASTRCVADVRTTLLRAARRVPPAARQQVISDTYRELIAEDPEKLLMRLQLYVAVAVASTEANGDRELGDAALGAGADRADETSRFMAYGMLINALVAMGFPAVHRVWSGVDVPTGGTRPWPHRGTSGDG